MLKVWTATQPHHAAFHLSWISFALAFFASFSGELTPERSQPGPGAPSPNSLPTAYLLQLMYFVDPRS